MIQLQKQKDKDFIILNLSDLQIEERSWDTSDPDCGNEFAIFDHTVRTLIERQRPDLITVTGDIAFSGWMKSYCGFADYIDALDIPWSIVWGNHDQQLGIESVDEVLEYYKRCKNFVYEDGDKALGNGNFVIEIVEDGKVVEGLIMMDSHDSQSTFDENGEEHFLCYDKLTDKQLDWYREQIAALKEKGCDKSAVFLHIPIYAYNLAWKAAIRSDIDPKAVTLEESYNGDCWNDGYKDSFGVGYEGICSPPEDEGMFDLIKELNATQHIIAGHDHVNNWVINYEGVQFIYAFKTGSGCYWNDKINGGTVFTVTSNGISDVRQEYVDIQHLL